MKRIIQVYFFLLPAVFGGIPAFFGQSLPQEISLYEGIRIAYLALGLPLLAWMAWNDRKQAEGKEIPLPIVASLAIPFFASVAVNGIRPFLEILSGQTYSATGFFFLAVLAIALAASMESRRSDALRALAVGFVVSNLPYAVAQVAGFDPILKFVILPQWGEGRAFGTLGNPNSLAFFADLCLPVAFALFSGKSRKTLVGSLLVIVLLSRSVSGITVAFAYSMWRGFFLLPWETRFGMMLSKGFLVWALMPFALGIPYLANHTKTLSLETRLAIVEESGQRIFADPKTFFLGDGAGAVERTFSFSRTPEVSKFVAADVPIDRAHFALLDIALVFGLPFALAVLSALFLAIKKNPEPPVAGILGIFFLLGCLHTPGMAEWVLTVVAAGKLSAESAFRKRSD